MRSMRVSHDKVSICQWRWRSGRRLEAQAKGSASRAFLISLWLERQ